MEAEIYPVIGNWYQRPEGQLFEVVAIDEQDGTVEIQYFDGQVEELDIESWSELAVSEAQPPEDWSGAYEAMEQDDLGYADVGRRPENWSSPLDEIDIEG